MHKKQGNYSSTQDWYRTGTGAAGQGRRAITAEGNGKENALIWSHQPKETSSRPSGNSC